MALAVMPYLPSPIASVLVKPACRPSPPSSWPVRGYPSADVLDRLTMRPQPASTMLLTRTAHQERAAQVHSHDRVPIIDGHLEQHVVADDAGVVDQHDRRAEFLGNLGHGRSDRVLVRHVGADGDRRPARIVDRRNGGAHESASRSSTATAIPSAANPLRHASADPSRRTGDDRHLLPLINFLPVAWDQSGPDSSRSPRRLHHSPTNHAGTTLSGCVDLFVVHQPPNSGTLMTDTGQRAVIVLAAGAHPHEVEDTEDPPRIGRSLLVGHALAGAAGIDPTT